MRPISWLNSACLAAVAVAISLSISRTTYAIDPPPSTAQMADLFEKIVFTTERQPHPSGLIVKWDVKRPVVVRTEGHLPPDIAKQVDRLIAYQFRQLAMVTNLEVVYPGTEKVNILLYFSDDIFADALGPRYEVLTKHFFSKGGADAAIRRHADAKARSLCFGFVALSSPSVISGAAIFIPTNKGLDVLRRCIAEETAQSLGLWSDTPLATLSLFNDDLPKSDIVAMTYPDMILLRALYDRRLQPGMTKGEAMPIARAVLAELLRR